MPPTNNDPVIPDTTADKSVPLTADAATSGNQNQDPTPAPAPAPDHAGEETEVLPQQNPAEPEPVMAPATSVIHSLDFKNALDIGDTVLYRNLDYPDIKKLHPAIVTEIDEDGETVCLFVIHRGYATSLCDIKPGEEIGQYQTL